ncbi:MAG: peptide deformylase [Alphaproteobacteria bacterium]|nr:MAG: peptide deformylase [Alphaproteobacteria bacterium]
MAVRDILKMGNPLLRTAAAEVKNPASSEIAALLQDMRDSMAAAGGVGIAAPQIGISKQVVIFEVPQARVEKEDGDGARGVPSTVLINPKIEPLSDEIALGWEGCLSVPGLRGLVPRYTHIRYRGLDAEGGAIDVEAKGFHARVVQHECDHLLGILYPERMTDMRFLVYESEAKAFMEGLQQGRAE